MRKIYILLWITLLSFSFSQAQQLISGTVKDPSGGLLPGANVIIKGTNKGTTTDFNGKFQLNATIGNTLEFSYVGFQTKDIKVDSRTTYDITLESGEQLKEVTVVGSRSAKRTAVDTPVPVDIINISELASQNGQVEITQILQYAAPSFNATKQSGSDGADHIVPASLRGLGPDQTLVLINGKRRHQSSLVNIFGTRGRGNSGTDLNAIPVAAIKRIEVLRDGASAQYGSDAIAGVINIVLNDNTDGLVGGVTYGAYSTAIGEGWEEKTGETLYNVEGKNRLDGKDKRFDGETTKFDLNYGVKLGDKGFANFTTELFSKEKTLRPGFSWRKGYGSAAVEAFNFMVNASLPLSDKTEIYAFGGRNFRDTNANAFSRESFADGDNRSVPTLYPNGFTPQITSEIVDASIATGIKYKMNNGWNADFSNTYGKNKFDYIIKNSNNASMKTSSPTTFDAGGHSLSQNTINLDFNKYFDNSLKGISLAFGAEFRTENFVIFSGEPASYGLYDINGLIITNPATQIVAFDSNGDDLPGGSQGFPGYSPANEVDESRNNLGIYTDAEFNLSDNFLVGVALRYENYSDFGSAFNYKLAGRYKVNNDLIFRASVSTGFRAPSLAQLYYNLIFTNIVNGVSLPSLLSANNSPVTRAFGIKTLTEEKAVNGSIGFTYKKAGFTATVDAYSISVDDRIILTDNFTDQTILGPLNVDAAQFFANGADTRTQGIDFVFTYNGKLNENSSYNVGIVGNMNDLKIEKIHNGVLNEFTFFSPFSRAYLKAAAPDYKLGLNFGFKSDKFAANATFTNFSKVKLQDFQWVDTPPTTQQEADALYAVATDIYRSAMTVDLNLSYQFSKSISFTIGGNNIFNQYPTPQFDGWTDQGGLMDSVQMGSDGAYFFGKLGFKF
jgi:iron complex outermembrane receptor protein